MNVALRSRLDRLDLISLCTGGGGLDLAVELAVPCARSVVMVEREAFAVAHLVAAMDQGRLAPAAIWSDVRTFDGRPFRGLVDGLIGGIPCQPHSLSGKRLGRDDPRELWTAARRIIVQSGAWFILIENVGGMLSSGGAERVYRNLGRLGFACEVGLFTAAEVGASHQRERLFILGIHDELADSNGQFDHRRGFVRQGRWRQSADGSYGLADSECDGRRQGIGWPSLQRRESQPHDGSNAMVDTARDGRGERWAEPELRSRRRAASLAGQPMDDAAIERGGAVPVQPGRQVEAGGDTDRAGAGYLFPPGPSDRENWQAALERAPELEPSFRRVADGLASRLDLARIDRLRMLGNGVVSLEGAYALRALATRLAGRGSAGAARLVRMMGAA